VSRSGIFGYINYLVEKDRKYILETLINGKYPAPLVGHARPLALTTELTSRLLQASNV
jgi:hypothetical protein